MGWSHDNKKGLQRLCELALAWGEGCISALAGDVNAHMCHSNQGLAHVWVCVLVRARICIGSTRDLPKIVFFMCVIVKIPTITQNINIHWFSLCTHYANKHSLILIQKEVVQSAVVGDTQQKKVGTVCLCVSFTS